MFMSMADYSILSLRWLQCSAEFPLFGKILIYTCVPGTADLYSVFTLHKDGGLLLLYEMQKSSFYRSICKVPKDFLILRISYDDVINHLYQQKEV